MTLPIELVKDIVQLHPDAKFWVHVSNGLAVNVQAAQTDRQEFH